PQPAAVAGGDQRHLGAEAVTAGGVGVLPLPAGGPLGLFPQGVGAGLLVLESQVRLHRRQLARQPVGVPGAVDPAVGEAVAEAGAGVGGKARPGGGFVPGAGFGADADRYLAALPVGGRLIDADIGEVLAVDQVALGLDQLAGLVGLAGGEGKEAPLQAFIEG